MGKKLFFNSLKKEDLYIFITGVVNFKERKVNMVTQCIYIGI